MGNSINQNALICIVSTVIVLNSVGCISHCMNNGREENYWPGELDESLVVGMWRRDNADEQGQASFQVLLLEADRTWLSAHVVGTPSSIKSVERIRRGTKWAVEAGYRNDLFNGMYLTLTGHYIQSDQEWRNAIVYVDRDTMLFGLQMRTILSAVHYQRDDASRQAIINFIDTKKLEK